MEQPAASSAGVPSDEQIADAIPTTAKILPGEPRKVCMTRMELRQFIAALAQRAPVQHAGVDVPDGYKLVLVPDEAAPDEPDWNECKRQAEVSTGLPVEQHTFSILKREIRRWIAHRQTTQAAPAACAERLACTAGRSTHHFEPTLCGHPCSCEQCMPCQCGACAGSAMADLSAAIEFTDQMRTTAGAGEEVSATGIARDALQWLERAARRVAKLQGRARNG